MSELKRYEYIGSGLALGSVVVVVAYSESAAQVLAELWCIGHQVEPETLILVEPGEEIDFPAVVYGWNGDY